MPIPVSCPNCRTSLQAPDSTIGRHVRCPSCGTTFPVHDVPEAILDVPRDRGPARYRDDDYDYGPPRRRPPYEMQPEGPNTGVQLGFGVAALAVGAVGVVISVFPCIGWYFGLWIGGLGIVLGLVGLVVALAQQGQGLAFPIAGLGVSLISILAGVLM